MNKQKLKECLKYEKKLILGNLAIKHILKVKVTQHSSWLRWKFVKYMRQSNYHNGIIKLIYEYKKNRIGNKLGYEINGKNIDIGLTIYHNGPIVINGLAVIGKNLVLHGDNCIGNDGITDKCPVIGDNVHLGVGVKVLGDVVVADNCTIGAGAIVVNSIEIPNSTVVGIPGRIVQKKRSE